MSRDDAHPALHTPPIEEHTGALYEHHYVPEGWEDFNRGICPCGEVVVWRPTAEGRDPEAEELVGKGVAGHWVPERGMRVLVLTSVETQAIEDMLDLSNDGDVPETHDMVRRQIELQDEVEGYEADEG